MNYIAKHMPRVANAFKRNPVIRYAWRILLLPIVILLAIFFAVVCTFQVLIEYMKFGLVSFDEEKKKNLWYNKRP